MLLNLSNNIILRHSYEKVGFYEITGWMFAVAYDTDELPAEKKSIGVYDYKRFTTKLIKKK